MSSEAGSAPRAPEARWRTARAAARRVLGAVSWADVLALLLLAALPWVMLLTLDDYGLTYDEEPHLRLGERVLEFYASGLSVSRGLQRSAYGAGFDLCAALLRRISPWDEYRTNHILCVFIAQLGYLGTWKLGRLLAGPLAGLLSLALLVLQPVYYGHQFNNPKDIPFAVGYVWGLYAIARLLRATQAGARPGLGLYASLVIALGLGMSVRVGGALLIAYLALFLGLLALERWLREGAGAARALWPTLAKAALAALGGWLLMLPFWPRALADPIDGPAAALETVTRYTPYDSPTLLDGRWIPSAKVPWSYLPTYFAYQLPELASICFIAACAALGACAWRRARRGEPLPWAAALLVAAVLVPPGYAIARGSTLYNGLRHFLFIFPPLCILGGAALAACLVWLGARRRLLLAPAALVLAVLAAEPALALVRLHPHQHVFFNRISGGLAPAVENYETEYYGSVYRELNARLVEAVWQQRRGEYLNRTFSVAGCGSKLFFTKNLPANFQYTSMRNANKADYYSTYNRDRCLERYRDRAIVTRVEREGASLGVARDLRRRDRKARRARARAGAHD